MTEKDMVKDPSSCLRYLAMTDENFGRIKGRVRGLEYRLKVCKSQEFLKASGSSAAANEQIAYASEAYSKMVEEYEGAVMDYEIMAAKRERAILTIEVWRTQESSRRKGNIV